jgi:4-hydroxybenzoate polyprenyltransferase
MTSDIVTPSQRVAGSAANDPATQQISLGRALFLVLREARWVVQGMFALRFAVGAVLAGVGGLLTWHTLAGLVSWTCVCVVIYALNGVSDVHGDRLNGSTRPIATGALPIRTAWQLIVWLTVLGLGAAALVSKALVLTYMLMFVIGWAYSFPSRPLKNSLPGLVVTGTSLGALSYLAGWLTVHGGPPHAELVVFAVAMSLWMGLIGSATKDLKDVPGDRATGRRTLPILAGPRRAMGIAAALAIAFGAAFPVVVATTVPAIIVPALFVLAGALVLVVTLLRARRGTADNGRRPYRIYMITQYVANFAALT